MQARKRRQCMIGVAFVAILLVIAGVLAGVLISKDKDDNTSSNASTGGSLPSSPTLSPTESPTLAPLTEEELQMLQYLADYSPVLQETYQAVTDINNNNYSTNDDDDLSTLFASPQFQALEWIVEQGGYSSVDNVDDADNNNNTSNETFLLETFALVTLYGGTRGDRWVNDTHWLHFDVDPCDWYGVECNNMNGSVTSLNLSFNKLRSREFHTLPEISLLRNLQSLQLQHNELKGSLVDVSTLTKLQTINVFQNELNGNLTMSMFGNLTELQTLNLGHNNMTIAMNDNSDWAVGLTNTLQTLILDDNHIDAELPWQPLSQLSTSLQTLRMPNTGLQGSLPAFVFQNAVNLHHLDLSHNPHMMGSLVVDILELPSLEYLDLSDTNLSGPLPDEDDIALISESLQYLDLSDIDLGGTLPASIAQWTSLTTLKLDHVGLQTEEFPSALLSLTNLQSLSLRNNPDLTGPWPVSLAEMTSLQELYLSNCSFAGTLPTTNWTTSLNLTTLHIGGNVFENDSNNNDNKKGLPVEELLLLAPTLTSLEIGHVEWSDLPLELSGLTMLQEFLAPSIGIKSKIPLELLLQWPSLQRFDLENNSLMGNIPAELTQLSQLTGILLNHNALTGTLPFELGDLTGLLEFRVAHNQLTGLVPYEYETWTSIHDFQLQGNDFSAEIGPPICGMMDWRRQVTAEQLTFVTDCLETLYCPCCTHCCLDGEQCREQLNRGPPGTPGRPRPPGFGNGPPGGPGGPNGGPGGPPPPDGNQEPAFCGPNGCMGPENRLRRHHRNLRRG